MKRGFVLLAALVPIVLFGQANLVPNSDFEEFGTVSGSFSPFDSLYFWSTPNTMTPDYINEYWFPNIADSQIPHSGSGYIGLATFDPDSTSFREYAQCQLLDTMVEDVYYMVTFFTSLSEAGGNYACNNIGIHLSDTALLSTNNLYFDVEPQIEGFNNELITDTLNWIEVKGIYQSNGTERFLSIGNFSSDSETTAIAIPGLLGYQAYYLFDDVSVIPIDSIPNGFAANAGPDQTIYIQDSAFIGQQIANLNCNWYELGGGQIASNTSGFYVGPTINTTYVVEQIIGNNVSYDTCTVFVIGLGIESNTLEDLQIYPIPNNGKFNVRIENTSISTDCLLVFSADGKLVFSAKLNLINGITEIVTDLHSGSYIAVVSDEKGKEIQRSKLVIVD